MKSRMGIKSGHLESYIRSLGQIKELPSGCSRGNISCSIDLKIGQDKTPMSLNLDRPGSYTTIVGKINEITFRHSRSQVLCSIDQFSSQFVITVFAQLIPKISSHLFCADIDSGERSRATRILKINNSWTELFNF